MASRTRALLCSVLVYVAFFASGAGCLIAEVTWNRMLIVVVGNSLSAAALIIAVFMGGLGLGSWIGGRVFGNRRPSLFPYLLLELAVGAYVLLSPTLFATLARLFTSLAVGVQDPAALTAVRLAVTAIALLLPAILMGATFPAIIGATATGRSARTGYLYSVNTLGAAIGCFAGGYHLLLEFGVRVTLTVACGLYALAALCALAAQAAGAARAPAPAPAGPPPAAPDALPAATGARRLRYLAVATFAIGFVALAYEVLLTRLAILYLGNSVSVFPLVLTGFLLGTGISAGLGTRIYDSLSRRARGDFRLFGWTALGAGAGVVAIPYLLLTDLLAGRDRFASTSYVLPANPWPIVGVIVAPTILIGALLPLAIRMLRPDRPGAATRGAATLYALNTAGGLLGASLVNHFLVPRVGTQGALILLAAICVAVGAAGLLGERRGPRRAVATAALTAAAALALALLLPSLPRLYADKIAAGTRARATQVKLVREGRAATVTVLDQDDPQLGTYRDMYLNGVEEASTRYWHTQLFKLLGILPVLQHASDGPKQVMVIAFGAGITAGSTLASDQVAAVDVVDLNPDIEGINDLFTDVNGDVFHQPRFHFHNDDGRNYLVTSGKSYDVIISDSTHPRAYDSWILYTEEFYRSVRNRLAPDGVFAQWVPVLGSMQGELMRIHFNTFRRVFPNATLWYVYGSDQAFLLATPRPLVIDTARLQRQLAALPAWFRAPEYQIDTVARVAGFFWQDEAAMTRFIGGETRVNRDDAHYFDKQSTVRPLPPQARLPFFQASAIPYLHPADDALRAEVSAQQAVAQQLSLYAFLDDKDALLRAYCALPDNGNARYFTSLEFSGRLPEPGDFCRDLELRSARAVVAQHPGNAIALNTLADLLAEAGRFAEALPLAEQAVALEPDNGMILDTLGWIQHRQGRTAPAIATLERAAARLPDHPIVLYHLGAARLAAGETRRGRELLTRALDSPGAFPGADEARRLLAR